MPYPKTPDSVKAAILRHYDDNKNDRQIAACVGVSPQWVGQYRRSLGLPLKNNPRKKSHEKDVKQGKITGSYMENGIMIVTCMKGYANNLLRWTKADRLF